MKWSNKDQTPRSLPVNADAIPASLKRGKKLVLWRWEWHNGRGEWSKVPRQPNGKNASSTNPDTWSTWAQVWTAYQRGSYSGIGRVLADDDRLICIDRDDCVHDRTLDTDAAALMELFGSYTEWSPTGTGIHIWVAGEWPNKGERNGHLEVYRSERYITLTGHCPWSEKEVVAKTDDLARWRQEYFGGNRVTAHNPEPDDAELIQQAQHDPAFAALWDGDTSAYDGDDSAADLALANMLVVRTDGDLWRADRLFRSSGLMRPKWDDKRGDSTYGRITLEKAAEGRSASYLESTDNAHKSLTSDSTDRTHMYLSLREVLKFPIDALPRVLRTWAMTIADWLQTPPEVPATFALAVLSGAIGHTYQIAPRVTFNRSAMVWAGVVGPPGVIKKTPSLEAATRPLHEWQQRLADEYRVEYAEYESDLERWGSAPKGDRGEKPQPPKFRHCLVNDVTMERLAEILGETPRGLLLERDELIGWVNAMNQYRSGAGADRQHYLSIWSSASIKVDRKTNPRPIYVPHPFVAITGGIQPSTVRLLPHKDGLFERVLWAWPAPLRMALPTDQQPSFQPIKDYALLVKNLLQLDFRMDDEGRMEPNLVRLTPDARKLWDQLDQQLHIDVVNADPDRASRVAKIDGQAASLALILHLVRFQSAEWINDDRYVDERSVQGGWDLANYYLGQSDRIFELAAGTEMDELGNRILRWMERHGKSEATTQTVRRANLPGLDRSSRIQSAFLDLEDHGYGAVKRTRVQGGIRFTFTPYATDTYRDQSVENDSDEDFDR